MLGGSTTRQLCKCWYGKIYKNNCYGGKKQGVEHCAEYYTSMHSIYTHIYMIHACVSIYVNTFPCSWTITETVHKKLIVIVAFGEENGVAGG